jgi:RimJ/RimL family protein N-acetyltransferase
MKVEPVELKGAHVTLQPMNEGHLDALSSVGLEPELWKWTINVCSTRDDMARYMQAAFADRDTGTALPFVTIESQTNTIVGSTRFGNIDRHHRKAEIGWTWINPTWQRTHVNTEAKLLMLTHAFETWRCVRVELKTDALNQRSRNAIERIGAKFEGILRNHMITDAGRYRDSAYFSVIESEWPDIKTRLERMLEPKTTL